MSALQSLFLLVITLLIPSLQTAHASERAVNAENTRLDTPSGYPVPRFVSLKTGKTYCRTGPSFNHPIKITFMRQGLPVVVVAETNDHWRKIRDQDGDFCWAHRSKLSGIDTALVADRTVTLRKKPTENAPERARLGGGVIVQILDRRGDWLRVSARGAKGWARQSSFWGAMIEDSFVAPHN